MAEKTPDRTPAAWTRECLSLLQSIHPDYRRNRHASGRFIEFVRPDPSGLLISQNFLRVRDDYSLSVALLFSERRSSQLLYYPLFAGSRFDHNCTVWRQFLDDFGIRRGDAGYPAGLWSFGPWRSNTLENLARGFAANEHYLVPLYRQALRTGKGRLVRIFEAAQRIVPSIDPDSPISAQSDRMGIPARVVESLPLGTARVEALALARGGNRYVGFGPDTNTVDLDSISPESLVLYFSDVFLAESDRLDQILSIAQKL
jgi:hypothetical protein